MQPRTIILGRVEFVNSLYFLRPSEDSLFSFTWDSTFKVIWMINKIFKAILQLQMISNFKWQALNGRLFFFFFFSSYRVLHYKAGHLEINWILVTNINVMSSETILGLSNCKAYSFLGSQKENESFSVSIYMCWLRIHFKICPISV